MTLAEITSLITSNIDTTGRRLTTGIKMREVLNAMVAYLSGIPSFVVSGNVWLSEPAWSPSGSLNETVVIQEGGIVSFAVFLTVSRGSNWDEIPIVYSGDAEFTPTLSPSSIPSNECITTVGLELDSYLAGTYTYDITVGDIELTLTVEVEP